MMTGDATVNRDAPIICCTAEILANLALREGKQAEVDYVIMDEFHYYSDKERGVAWQVPLLTLPQANFLLMSATLGDVSFFEKAIAELTGRDIVTVKSKDRPVPLTYQYQETPLHETIYNLVTKGKAPVYLVSFTQRGAAEEAQNLMSVDFCTKDEKKRIAQELAGEPFRSPYGREIQKLLRHGIGIHHAGLLPRYRLLVEKLAQKGLLKVISGTDTLGVGVNIPLRSVLFTKLCKYDGNKTTILSVRDFQQIAGRAGRKGFDDEGLVLAQAPEHVVENLRMEAKTTSDPSKKRKFVRKKPPEHGYVAWDKSTFERLVSSDPEPLTSRFQVSHSMLIAVLGRAQGGCRAMKDLVRMSHEGPTDKKRHMRTSVALLRSLWQAGIVELRAASDGGGIRVSEELQREFSLFQALGLWLLDTVERLDPESETYTLDVLSLVEAVLENPDTLLYKQLDKLKGQKVAEMKGAGVEYDERMAELDKLTYPQPNAEMIFETFEAFAKEHPWVKSENIRPKGIVREMFESLHSFGGYVKELGLQRSEGVLLRYLTEAYKTLVQTVPDNVKTEGVDDLIAYLGAIVRGVDASLLDEWERMRDPAYVARTAADVFSEAAPTTFDITRDEKAFTAMVRNQLFAFVRSLARRDWNSALELLDEGEEPWTEEKLAAAFTPFLDEFGAPRLDGKGRSPSNTQVQPTELSTGRGWSVIQNLVVGDEISEWVVEGAIDLEASARLGRVVFVLTGLHG
jgi:superfamily II RNA helicase